MELQEVLSRALVRPGSQEFYQWLKTTDFFTAPASTRYHSNYEGGLVKHSLNVVHNLLRLTRKFSIKWDRDDSPYLIGLFHDLCKANFYKSSTRNVKNEDTQKWEKVPYYEVDDKFPMGHGCKSVILLQRYLHLTDQEIFCITYHMQAFGDSSYVRDFSMACNKYPEILVVGMADQLAGIKETLIEKGEDISRYADFL